MHDFQVLQKKYSSENLDSKTNQYIPHQPTLVFYACKNL